MPLTPEQNTLYDRIYESVRNRESIDEIIKEVKKEDFLKMFTATKSTSEETLLGTFETTSVGHLQAVLKFAKELGLLEEVVRAKILSSKNQDEVESISPIEYIMDSNRKSSLDFLHAIQGSCGLESFWEVISEDDRERIKTKLNENEHEHKDVLDKINLIEKTMIEEKRKSDLFIKLHKKFREVDDIDGSLREIENKGDFLSVFSMFYVKDGDTILGSYESLKVKQVQAVLNRAKELDIPLADILNMQVFLLSFDSESKKRESISLDGCIKNPDFKFLTGVLHAINESYGLKSLWEVISEDDRESIKTRLDEGEHKDVLDEINRIEEIMMEKKRKNDLFIKLHEKFREVDDIDGSLREIENKGDFLSVFSMFYVKDGDTILGSYESLKVKQVQAVLNRAKELDIPLADILNMQVFLLSFDSESKKRESISLDGCIKNPDFKFLTGVLHAINESYGLKSLWEVISEDDRESIKTRLDEGEHKDVLDEINRIEEIIRTESKEVQADNTADYNLSETSSLASDESTINSKSNSATDTVPQSDPIKPMCKATLDMGNGSESRKDAAKKGMKFGAICGVIAALAVGGGLFAAGAQLPILALIGIAVAAALVTGFVAGGITYKMSKPSKFPSENLNNVDLSEQIYLSLGV